MTWNNKFHGKVTDLQYRVIDDENILNETVKGLINNVYVDHVRVFKVEENINLEDRWLVDDEAIA